MPTQLNIAFNYQKSFFDRFLVPQDTVFLAKSGKQSVALESHEDSFKCIVILLTDLCLDVLVQSHFSFEA